MDGLLSAIQWLGTLSMAFVAIGFVESFTTNICKRLFHSDKDIENAYQECINILPDSETIKSLEPTIIDGTSTNDKIEKLKIQNDDVRGRIKEATANNKKELPEVCQVPTISSTSLFIVILCSVLLVACGIESKFPLLVDTFVFSASLLSCIYIIVGWFFTNDNVNDNDKQKKKALKYTSLRHSLICIAILLVISLIFAGICYCKDWTMNKKYSLFILVGNILIGYLNFIVLSFITRKRVKKYKKDLEGKKADIKKECEEIKQDTDKLLAVAALSKTLRAK